MPPEQQDAGSSTPENAAPSAPTPAPAPFIPHAQNVDDQYASAGWSWAAFMQGPFFLVAIRKYVFLWLYLLMLVPGVNLFASLGIAIFLGVKGREYAAESPTFTNRDQYVGFMKAADHAGKIMFFAALILVALGVVIALSVGSTLTGGW